MHAITPSANVDSSMVSDYQANDAMGNTFQLYTARGEQGMGTTSNLLSFAGVVANEDNQESVLKWHYKSKEKRFLGKH